jgi:hypothetical protein
MRSAKDLCIDQSLVVQLVEAPMTDQYTNSQRGDLFMTNNGQLFEDDDDFDEEEYDDMELLERLETLREDMEELGVTTLDEVIQRIEELHQQLDAR